MAVAKIFNKRDEQEIENIFGAVTNGNQWKFLKLKKDTIYIDLDNYYIMNPEVIIGILNSIVKPKAITTGVDRKLFDRSYRRV